VAGESPLPEGWRFAGWRNAGVCNSNSAAHEAAVAAHAANQKPRPEGRGEEVGAATAGAAYFAAGAAAPISSRSTSKINVAPGGIEPWPLSP